MSELDLRLEVTGLFSVRFMDDILVLTTTRWKLRRAVRVLNHVLASLACDSLQPGAKSLGPIDQLQ